MEATPNGVTLQAGGKTQAGARPGNLSMADLDGAAFHRAQPITREHVQAVLRRISRVEVEVKVLHQSTTFTDRAYQTTSYRRGRVLLSGDAAHVHSPLGGQGLNLGLGDAMNLGWSRQVRFRTLSIGWLW